jgi:uncharacterized protein DUF6263
MRKLIQFVIALLLITPSKSQTVHLSLNLQKGERYDHIQNSKVSVNETVNGQDMEIVMTVYAKTAYVIKDITDQFYNMEVIYKNLNLEMQLPQGTMQYSSSKKDTSDLLSTLLSRIANKPFYVQMTRTGKVQQVTGFDSLLDNMIKKMNIPEIQKTALKEQMSKAYGPKSMKGSIETVTSIFPDKPVAKNDHWIINTQLESAMSANLKETFEYKGSTDSTSLIHGEGIIQTADKDAFIETNGMPLKYDLTGTLTADFIVDKKSGWIMEARINQLVKGTAQIKDNPKMPGGMSIPMTIKGETEIRD